MGEQINAAGSESKPLRLFASIVSYVCHPVFLPIVMSLVIYWLSPSSFAGMTSKQTGLLFISIALTGVFFPLFSIGLMKPLGFISSFHMPTARERTIPLMATMIFYFWISHVANSLPGTSVPLIIRVLLLGNFWGVIALFMINIFTKISMHTAAAGGMVGILLVLLWTSPVNLIMPLLVSIVIAGIIGTARIILGAHQRGDIWLGYIIGIAVQLGAYAYAK